MGITDLDAYRKRDYGGEEWVSCPAICLQCNYEWMAVMETGITDHLECPECNLDRGVLQHNIEPRDDEMVFSCIECEYSAFWVTTTGVLCRRCGTRTTYKQLAEAES